MTVYGSDMPPTARGCLSTEGTGRGSLEYIVIQYLFTSKICHRIMEQWLLAGIVINILEEILLETLGMSHLSKDLSVTADDTFDRII